jgi:hypothetical protein
LDNEFFPFEKYIGSLSIDEYNRDIRRKNYLIKYVNIIVIDNLDTVSLDKLLQSLIFFRNVFSKDAFLFFFNEYFEKDEKKVLASIIYDLFVVSKAGEVGEYRDFIRESVNLYKYVDREHVINKIWDELKIRQEIIL